MAAVGWTTFRDQQQSEKDHQDCRDGFLRSWDYNLGHWKLFFICTLSLAFTLLISCELTKPLLKRYGLRIAFSSSPLKSLRVQATWITVRFASCQYLLTINFKPQAGYWVSRRFLSKDILMFYITSSIQMKMLSFSTPSSDLSKSCLNQSSLIMRSSRANILLTWFQIPKVPHT